MMSSWLGSSFSASAAEVPGPERPAPAAPSNPLSPERTRADFLLAEQKNLFAYPDAKVNFVLLQGKPTVRPIQLDTNPNTLMSIFFGLIALLC